MPHPDKLIEFRGWSRLLIAGDEKGCRARRAVRAAYGFGAKRDLPAQFLALNRQIAAKIENGSPVHRSTCANE